MNTDEFKEYLLINKHDLDEEIIQQPILLFEVAEACADAAILRDNLKERLATVDAQLDAEIREELEGGKVTESIVKNRIQVDSRHDKAFQEYANAKHRADVLSALKDAFASRGYLLRDLAALHNANYFESNAVKDATEATYRRAKQQLTTARQRKE